MPRRVATERFDTEDVQGEGSWVEVRKLTVGQTLALRQQAADGDADPFEAGVALIRQHLVAWNWADEDGNPLPQPAVDPDVVLGLTDDELLALAQIVRGYRKPLRAKN